MKWTLRILALVGTTVFGLSLIGYIAIDSWFYIEIYRLDHRFPIYGLERDLRHHLIPNLLALVLFGSLYLYLVRKMRINSN
jgi:hypothetical protein